MQFSVCEFRLSPARLARLIGQVEDAIEEQEDSVILYRFKGKIEDATVRLGRPGERTLGQPWLL